jgi:hypothetical protein
MIVKSEEQCENYCLTKEITKESEMADTKGSTATEVDRNVWMLGEGVCSFCSRETKALQA